jgi:hypothetical protein
MRYCSQRVHLNYPASILLFTAFFTLSVLNLYAEDGVPECQLSYQSVVVKPGESITFVYTGQSSQMMWLLETNNSGSGTTYGQGRQFVYTAGGKDHTTDTLVVMSTDMTDFANVCQSRVEIRIDSASSQDAPAPSDNGPDTGPVTPAPAPAHGECQMTLSLRQASLFPGDITFVNGAGANAGFMSSNSGVVQVNGNGRIVAVAPGTAAVTVTGPDGCKKDIGVTVKEPYSFIALHTDKQGYVSHEDVVFSVFFDKILEGVKVDLYFYLIDPKGHVTELGLLYTQEGALPPGEMSDLKNRLAFFQRDTITQVEPLITSFPMISYDGAVFRMRTGASPLGYAGDYQAVLVATLPDEGIYTDNRVVASTSFSISDQGYKKYFKSGSSFSGTISSYSASFDRTYDALLSFCNARTLASAQNVLSAGASLLDVDDSMNEGMRQRYFKSRINLLVSKADIDLKLFMLLGVLQEWVDGTIELTDDAKDAMCNMLSEDEKNNFIAIMDGAEKEIELQDGEGEGVPGNIPIPEEVWGLIEEKPAPEVVIDILDYFPYRSDTFLEDNGQDTFDAMCWFSRHPKQPSSCCSDGQACIQPPEYDTDLDIFPYSSCSRHDNACYHETGNEYAVYSERFLQTMGAMLVAVRVSRPEMLIKGGTDIRFYIDDVPFSPVFATGMFSSPMASDAMLSWYLPAINYPPNTFPGYADDRYYLTNRWFPFCNMNDEIMGERYNLAERSYGKEYSDYLGPNCGNPLAGVFSEDAGDSWNGYLFVVPVGFPFDLLGFSDPCQTYRSSFPVAFREHTFRVSAAIDGQEAEATYVIPPYMDGPCSAPVTKSYLGKRSYKGRQLCVIRMGEQSEHFIDAHVVMLSNAARDEAYKILWDALGTIVSKLPDVIKDTNLPQKVFGKKYGQKLKDVTQKIQDFSKGVSDYVEAHDMAILKDMMNKLVSNVKEFLQKFGKDMLAREQEIKKEHARFLFEKNRCFQFLTGSAATELRTTRHMVKFETLMTIRTIHDVEKLVDKVGNAADFIGKVAKIPGADKVLDVWGDIWYVLSAGIRASLFVPCEITYHDLMSYRKYMIRVLHNRRNWYYYWETRLRR